LNEILVAGGVYDKEKGFEENKDGEKEDAWRTGRRGGAERV
jgi:hypothetical protein